MYVLLALWAAGEARVKASWPITLAVAVAREFLADCPHVVRGTVEVMAGEAAR